VLPARGVRRLDYQLLAARPEAGATAVGVAGHGNGAHDRAQEHQGSPGCDRCPVTKQRANRNRGPQRSPKMQKAGDEAGPEQERDDNGPAPAHAGRPIRGAVVWFFRSAVRRTPS